MSKFKFLAVVVAMFAPLMAFSTAQAASVAPSNSVEAVKGQIQQNSNIVQVKGCHGNAKYHWVGKWGTKAWHRHGYNCNPKPVKKKWKPKKKKWGHCHKAFKKHWHGGWGGGWHRHVGPNCWPKKGKQHHGYKKGCLKIGPVWVCP